MAIKELWLNLPVKDINKSKTFFTQLGFSFNTQYGNSDHSACLLIGQKNVVIMLFEESSFKSFSNHEIADTSHGNEVLLSIDAESRQEVDEFAKKVIAANGIIYNGPGEKDGWTYGLGFIDLDGHRWSMVFMDFGKMQKP